MTRHTGVDQSLDGAKGDVTGEEAVDLGHLSEFTIGDRSVQKRILTAFKRQSRIDLKKLSNPKTIEDWQQAAHSLKNSASAIGAWNIVRDADAALELKWDQLNLDVMRNLIERVEEANGYIEKILESD